MLSDNVGETLRLIARTSATPSRDLDREGVVERIPELAQLASVMQDPRWHPEGDVLTHSLFAADAAARLCGAQRDLTREEREIVVLAALFHDVGKPATTKSESGFLVSPGHAALGGEIVLSLGDRLAWPIAATRAVACIVENHMVPVSVIGDPTPKAVRRLRARLDKAGTSIREWSMVVEADGAARGVASTVNRAEPWVRIALGMFRSVEGIEPPSPPSP